jgi:pimeloyl-ACP methyl ester carboxylesterase
MEVSMRFFTFAALAALCIVTPLTQASCGLGSGRSSTTLNFLDRNSLRKSSVVRQALTEEYGLQPIKFTSEDGENLRGLLLERPNAVATLVVCPGLWCKKEMYAALINILPSNYNILIFDARGQGQSRGWNMYLHVRSYGKQEWKDVKSAITEVAYRYANKPIFVMGFCSGAYHAARALIELRKQELIETLNIKGLIFDSGWYSVYQASQTAPYDMIKSFLKDKLGGSRVGGMSSKLMYMILYPVIAGFKKLMLDPIYWKNEKKLNIFDTLHTTNIPILFIQSQDDTQIPFEQVYNLSQTIPDHLAATWWIEPGRSKHAWHFLYMPAEYRHITHDFLDHALSRR